MPKLMKALLPLNPLIADAVTYIIIETKNFRMLKTK